MEKKTQNPGTFGRLLSYVFGKYAVKIAVVIVCIIISAISSVAATSFMQKLIDECITPGLTEGFEAVAPKILGTLFAMAIIYLAGVFCSWLYTRLMATVTQGTLEHLRVDMYDKMQDLPLRYFDSNSHGDIMSTYTNDTDAIRQLIGQSLPTLIQSVLTIGAIFLLMLNYSIWLTLVVIAFIAVMLTVVKKLGGNSAKYMDAQQKSVAKEEGYIEEIMNGQKVVKVFCHEDESKKDFTAINDELFGNSNLANKYGNILMPALNNLGNIMYVVIAIVGAVLALAGAMNLSLSGAGVITVGIIVSFLSMARQLSQTLGQTSMQVSMIAMGVAGAARVFALMDEQPERDEGYVTMVRAKKNAQGEYEECADGEWVWRHPHQEDGSVTYEPLKGDIELQDVDFGYVPEKQVLHGITLHAKPGQKIAFVGATGAGKTTITNLINRFYDIDGGKIRYDGINIKKIKKADLRGSLGIVLQDVNLFTGTVMENIRYGRLDATDEECIAAAKLANADGFISRLPEGYNTMLTGNAANLSQGQRQLISIARAAVANPPVMILDEATSSIDTRTEALVQDGMDNLMKGRTVFVIAHRLSTVRNSDEIIVLDHGRIREQGTHDELMEKKGSYYQLYTGAFELE